MPARSGQAGGPSLLTHPPGINFNNQTGTLSRPVTRLAPFELAHFPLLHRLASGSIYFPSATREEVKRQLETLTGGPKLHSSLLQRE
jgi:hypothetical protein